MQGKDLWAVTYTSYRAISDENDLAEGEVLHIGAQPKINAADNEAVRAQLRAVADYAIVPLQYAVDLGEATEEEQALLTKWKLYCVRLNRVDITVPEPDWPEVPA